MNKLIILLLVIGSFVSTTFAGELRNSKTNELIKFKVEDGLLKIDGSAAGIPSHQIPIDTSSSVITKKVKAIGSPDGLYIITSDISDEFNPIGILLSFAIETVILPVRAPFYIGKSIRVHKDIQLLEKVIATNETFEINYRQFRRMKSYFNFKS